MLADLPPMLARDHRPPSWMAVITDGVDRMLAVHRWVAANEPETATMFTTLTAVVGRFRRMAEAWPGAFDVEEVAHAG